MKTIYNIYCYNTSIGYSGRTVVRKHEVFYSPLLEECIIDMVGGTVLKGFQPMRTLLESYVDISTYGLEPEFKRWYV